MRGLFKRFCQDESGSVEIEFALVAAGAFAVAFLLLKNRGKRKLQSLSQENQKLKHLLTEAMLDNVR